jgi:ferritin-like protein
MTDRMMQFFGYSHLPEHLQATSRQFHALATWVEANLPANPERTVALRRLLESKDCAVRAMIYNDKVQ